MINTSLKAYYNKSNQNSRLKTKSLIEKVFKETKDCFSTRDIEVITGINYNSCQKRVSDLLKENKIFIVSQKIENRNIVNVYAYNIYGDQRKNCKKSNYELIKLAISKSCSNELTERILKEYKRMKSL